MRLRFIFLWLLVLTLLVGFQRSVTTGRAAEPQSKSAHLNRWDVVAPDELIAAMNALRVANGHPALIEDPIIDAVAQSTAEIMAASQMSSHIGDVRGRLAAAGYGGGATVWATENFAVGNMSIDEIMVVWSDSAHMLPAVVAAYCNVGAGVARSSNGMYYYILQAAYTSARACGEYTSPAGSSPPSGPSPVSQLIIPVKVATPDVDGKIYHVVEAGQSLWAIAIAYHITIHDLEVWNNISRETSLQIGQRLFIPGSNTAGYFTPTPVGMVVTSTPDAQGKVIHTVQPYQTLITIAQAYGVTVDSILALNGLQVDWPLQIGQKLLISPGWVTPSPTPLPLSPVEKLTPASDGNYYHIVQSGETLSWIASLYKIKLADLMAWNGLNNASIIHPNQKLLLRVTPPATLTLTPAPPSVTATSTKTPRPPTATMTATHTVILPTATDLPVTQSSAGVPVWPFVVVIVVAALVLSGLVYRKKYLNRPTNDE
jgi:LysM repeat protein/uncharacterized protein YkwD